MERYFQVHRCGWWRVGAALWLALLVHCGPQEQNDSSQGLAPEAGHAVAVSIAAQTLAETNVAKVLLTASNAAANLVQTSTLTTHDNLFSVQLYLPDDGLWSFHAAAYDPADQLLFEGEKQDVLITSGQTTAVHLWLQQKSLPTPFVNTAPDIDALVMNPSTVTSLTLVHFSVSAHDTDPNTTLEYTWSANTATAIGETNHPEFSWKAPAEEGTYQVTITVQDHCGATTSVTIDVMVQPPLPLNPEVDLFLHYNTAPTLALVTTDQGLVRPGGPMQLTAQAADADGDALTYQWSNDPNAGCQGAFNDPASANPVWTAPAALAAGGEKIDCTLRVDVSDGRGGSNYGLLTIHFGPPPPVLPAVPE